MTAIGPPGFGAVAAWQLDLGVVPPLADPTPATWQPNPPVPNLTPMSFASSDYRGRVDAVLGRGLDPGRYEIVIEGITETQFAQAKTLAAQLPYLCANLFLYWADATTALPSPVAVLRVIALRRRAGHWRYELHVEAREWVYDLLSCPAAAVKGVDALDCAQQLVSKCNVKYVPPAVAAAAAPDPNASVSSNSKLSTLHALEDLARDMAKAAGAAQSKRGTLSMFQMRDGQLMLGPGRLDQVAALAAAKPVSVDATNGLVTVERNGTVRASDDPAPSAGGSAPDRRPIYVATLRGRPDLKPGDVVQLKMPELDPSDDDFDLGAAPVAANTSPFVLIEEVAHKLSREAGFSTVMHCLAAADGALDVDKLWFQTTTTDSAPTSGGSEGQVARRLRKPASSLGTAVAQVRQLYGQGDNAPMLTEKLRRNTVDDGLPHGAVRVDFTTGYDAIDAVPYATPFAWGKFGLSVPRYPGMRVALAHGGGGGNDAIDIGALWDSNQAPPAQPGDWWLSLPAAIPPAQRASVDDASTPPPPGGKASNDLIDADGTRVIAVGKLTVRVGTAMLGDAGARPSASDPVVSIESGQASITIDQNGAITIHSHGKMTLTSDADIEIDASSIAMSVSSSVAISKKLT